MSSIYILLLMSYFKAFNTNNFENYPVYNGNDLGLQYNNNNSKFKVWAPTAKKLSLLLYASDEGGTPLQVYNMQKQENGVFFVQINENLLGKYYCFQATIDDYIYNQVADPYAKAVGVNGKRAQVVDLLATNPPNWDQDCAPFKGQPVDAVLYELHVRDFSIHPNSGIKNKGKFLAFTEENTQNTQGDKTGTSHIKDLGITHVHLLPSFDFHSVDESKPQTAQYNWGYDPENYNVPEGSYASNAHNGATRINEFKRMIQSLHNNGLAVVMDVVYNHCFDANTVNFNQLVPNYYFRQNEDGTLSNASACGNETASERPMMQKFMIESLKYWVQEYHIDGFRFDLMGIHDIETMNKISAELHAINPNILLYGEGWTGGNSPLPENQRAIKQNTYKLNAIAAFSDDFRDALKGSVFNSLDQGFVSGKAKMENSVKFGIVGGVKHQNVSNDDIIYSKAPWALDPNSVIGYISCHDNLCLWDKLAESNPENSIEERIKMHKLAYSIVITAQSVPFIHAGDEFLRSKYGVENSYNSPDSINAIDWNLKSSNKETYLYFKQLIELRKAHSLLRLGNAQKINNQLEFIPTNEPNLIAYSISNQDNSDTWTKVIVIHNANPQSIKYRVAPGSWKIALKDYKFPNEKDALITEPLIELEGISTTIMYLN